MWVPKNLDWSKKHTDLTKYFFEKVKQQVDYDELVTNTHRTTNGYTIIKEIIDVAELTLRRKKSFKRLETLILEATEKNLQSNIVNDYIIKNYHTDIPVYYKDITIKDDVKLIKDLCIKSKIFYYRLQGNYFDNILHEVRNVDFNTTSFSRTAIQLDNIINVLIPYLLFIGYSPTSISDIAYRMVKKDYGVKGPLNFLFHFQKGSISYDFLLITKAEEEYFYPYLRMLSRKNIDFFKLNIKSINAVVANKPDILQPNECFFEFTHKCKDPHNYIRHIYEKTLRTNLLEQPRVSLSKFNDYFDKIYWKFSQSSQIYRASNITIDPININRRKNTLMSTLSRLCPVYNYPFNKRLPIVPEIQDSVYYYNLALGSKSIENSLFLLWSSLESLVPYRFKQNDIENVQYFVSRSLSIGGLGRMLTSFCLRFIECANVNKIDTKGLPIKVSLDYKTKDYSNWAKWLSDDSKIGMSDDPYNLIKQASNLLCNQYVNLNLLFSGHDNKYTVEDISKRLHASYKSIEFQLDRIYLHRNQIVHSGKFINEYSNLWLHLEWYVGKLLSCLFLRHYRDLEGFDKEKVFMEIEGDYDLIHNLLSKYQEKKVKDIDFAFDKLFQHTWQFF